MVYGFDGMDELIVIGVFYVVVLSGGEVIEFEVYLEDVDLLVYFFEVIIGGIL